MMCQRCGKACANRTEGRRVRLAGTDLFCCNACSSYSATGNGGGARESSCRNALPPDRRAARPGLRAPGSGLRKARAGIVELAWRRRLGSGSPHPAWLLGHRPRCAAFDGFRFLRVFPPFDRTPVGLHG